MKCLQFIEKNIEKISLVTTSIKYIDGIEFYSKILNSIFENSSCKAQFICFENGFSTSDAVRKLSKLSQDKILYRDAVVDRVCSTFSEHKNGSVVCKTEKYKMIALSKLNRYHAEYDYLKYPEYVLEYENIDAIRKMKIWLMNGGHMLCSIHAHFTGEFQFDKFCRENKDLVEEQILEIVYCYSAWIKNNSMRNANEYILFAENYASDLWNRYQNNSDDVGRLLKDLLDEDKYVEQEGRVYFDFKDIFGKLVDRVSDPVDEYFKRYQTMQPFTGIALSRLNRILANRNIPV